MLKQAAIVAVCLVGTHVIVSRPTRPAVPAARERLESFPLQIGTFTSAGTQPLDARTLSVLGADDYLNRPYRDPAEPPVDLYIGYYGQQRQSSTIHSPLNCLPGSGWQVMSHDTIGVGQSHAVVNRMRVRNEVTQLVVLYWYQSHGRVLASEYWSKWYLAFDALRLSRTDGALVRATSPVLEWDANGQANAERRIVRLVEQMLPLLGRYIPA